MNQAELFDAFRVVASEEFSDVPDNSQLHHIFSNRFEKRMNKLIRNQANNFWYFVNTTKKRIAIAVFACFALTATACSVPEILEPIVEFIEKTYDTFTQFFFDRQEKPTITKEYSISPLPDEFIEVSVERDDNVIKKLYRHSNGNSFSFSQLTLDYSTTTFDLERDDFKHLTINDLDVYLYQSNNSSAVCFSDEYVFFLDYYGNITTTEFCDLIARIQ